MAALGSPGQLETLPGGLDSAGRLRNGAKRPRPWAASERSLATLQQPRATSERPLAGSHRPRAASCGPPRVAGRPGGVGARTCMGWETLADRWFRLSPVTRERPMNGSGSHGSSERFLNEGKRSPYVGLCFPQGEGGGGGHLDWLTWLRWTRFRVFLGISAFHDRRHSEISANCHEMAWGRCVCVCGLGARPPIMKHSSREFDDHSQAWLDHMRVAALQGGWEAAQAGPGNLGFRD